MAEAPEPDELATAAAAATEAEAVATAKVVAAAGAAATAAINEQLKAQVISLQNQLLVSQQDQLQMLRTKNHHQESQAGTEGFQGPDTVDRGKGGEHGLSWWPLFSLCGWGYVFTQCPGPIRAFFPSPKGWVAYTHNTV